MGRSKNRHRNGDVQSPAPANPLDRAERSFSDEQVPETETHSVAAGVCEDADIEDPSGDADRQAPAAPDVDAQLYEKDELIAALTAQLEETVERLDRLHRQGADRGGRSQGGSGSSEFLEDQRLLSERLNQWLDVWDQSQPLEMWSRIEARLEQARWESSPAAIPEPLWPEPQSTSAPDTFCDAPAAPVSDWEIAKQRLLGELGSASEPAAPAAAAPPPPAEQAAAPADIEYPAAVDLANASREELCRGIDIRDRYISHLTHRLRSAEIRQPVDWEALNEAPADLRHQLQELEVRYREHLRREEVDFSLERARLAREQAKLEQDRQRFVQQLKRAGIMPESSSSEMDDEDRSWRKMFGRKK